MAATNGGNSGANVTNHTFNLPTGIASDDLLIIIASFDAVPTVTWPSGWTQLIHTATTNNFATFDVYYRIADGTEGSTITVTTSTSEGSAHTSYRITGYQGTPEVCTVVVANTNVPNPCSLSPSWGADDTLWLAVMGYNGNHSISAFPTNYSNTISNRWASSNGTGVGSGERQLNAASEDPGTFTISASNDTAASTLAVRGAAAGADQPPLRRQMLAQRPSGTRPAGR
ncbi:MAG TPA: hypothetical protein VNN18_06780 [Candidatus Xenobia bacterium]|nr:hypothetical protein [Candidatus Xenobia bacterium]